MTTRKTAHHVSTVSPSTSAVAASPETTTATSTTANGASIVFIKPPPPIDSIPSVPDGYTNSEGTNYSGVLPKDVEQSAMPDVLDELARFTEYTSVFGKTAPPLAFVLQTFTAAGQWTAMRVKTGEWDTFSRTQEGASWSDAREIMASLAPAFTLAVKTDATLARQFPALVRLFDARSSIARRASATRKANAKDVSEGKPPSHGKAARAAKRTAKLVAAAQSQTTPAANTAQTAAAPATTPAAPVHVATPVVASPPPTASPATNGAAGGTSVN